MIQEAASPGVIQTICVLCGESAPLDIDYGGTGPHERCLAVAARVRRMEVIDVACFLRRKAEALHDPTRLRTIDNRIRGDLLRAAEAIERGEHRG